MSNLRPLRVVVLVGHPDKESFNGQIARRYAQEAQAQGAQVSTLYMGEMDFDLSLRHGYQSQQALEPDLLTSRRALEEADHVVLAAPLWWGAVPAVCKGWFDRLFLSGWAFRMQDNGLPQKLLKGRSARVVLTMDSPAFWYWLVYRGSAHAMLIQATLKFVGFGPVKATSFYRVFKADASKRQKWLQQIAELAHKDMARLRREAPRLLVVPEG